MHQLLFVVLQVMRMYACVTKFLKFRAISSNMFNVFSVIFCHARQPTWKVLYCGFPSSCNAKRHALYKHLRAQLFSRNRFLVTETHSQDFSHAYAYNSTATEHCTGCRCSLQNCAYAHYVSASRFALQELGKPQYRRFEVGWQYVTGHGKVTYFVTCEINRTEHFAMLP